MLYTLHFFSSKCNLFHNSNLFGSCIIHILHTGCAKIKKKIRRQKVKLLVFRGADRGARGTAAWDVRVQGSAKWAEKYKILI